LIKFQIWILLSFVCASIPLTWVWAEEVHTEVETELANADETDNEMDEAELHQDEQGPINVEVEPVVIKAKEVWEGGKKKYEFVTAPIFEDITGVWKSSFVGLGNYIESYRRVQADENGGKNGIGLWPYLKGGMEFGTWKGWSALPEIGLSFPNTSEDDSVTRYFYYIKADFLYRWKPWLNFRVGTSMFFNQYRPKKTGTVQLNNGTNPNSNFYLPNRVSTAINNTFDFGIEGFIRPHLSLQLQASLYSLAISEKRRTSVLMAFHYYFQRKDSL
jgi:hypothetical protein